MWINHCYIERTNCVKRYIAFTTVFLIELFHSYTHRIVDKMQTFNLHLVSDSTGDTVSSVARAALVQFEGVEAEEHMWTLVRTRGQIDKVLEKNKLNLNFDYFKIPPVSNIMKNESLKREAWTQLKSLKVKLNES